eukprot:TRINITY_DN917_c0_g1_i1.p1 TRINITY_DN917_c0_g1~~TRINITY_DN917_c0_g1_i1.p1  ORF type:complete len:423 (+),score=74.30 TRINITY_DN917_c0_g1_i1:25-1293(+)
MQNPNECAYCWLRHGVQVHCDVRLRNNLCPFCSPHCRLLRYIEPRWICLNEQHLNIVAAPGQVERQRENLEAFLRTPQWIELIEREGIDPAANPPAAQPLQQQLLHAPNVLQDAPDQQQDAEDNQDNAVQPPVIQPPAPAAEQQAPPPPPPPPQIVLHPRRMVRLAPPPPAPAQPRRAPVQDAGPPLPPFMDPGAQQDRLAFDDLADVEGLRNLLHEQQGGLHVHLQGNALDALVPPPAGPAQDNRAPPSLARARVLLAFALHRMRTNDLTERIRAAIARYIKIRMVLELRLREPGVADIINDTWDEVRRLLWTRQYGPSAVWAIAERDFLGEYLPSGAGLGLRPYGYINNNNNNNGGRGRGRGAGSFQGARQPFVPFRPAQAPPAQAHPPPAPGGPDRPCPRCIRAGRGAHYHWAAACPHN